MRRKPGKHVKFYVREGVYKPKGNHLKLVIGYDIWRSIKYQFFLPRFPGSEIDEEVYWTLEGLLDD